MRSYYVHGGSLKLCIYILICIYTKVSVMAGKSPTAFASLLLTINQKVNNLLKRQRRVGFCLLLKAADVCVAAGTSRCALCLFVLRSQWCIRLFASFISYFFSITALSGAEGNFLFGTKRNGPYIHCCFFKLLQICRCNIS